MTTRAQAWDLTSLVPAFCPPLREEIMDKDIAHYGKSTSDLSTGDQDRLLDEFTAKALKRLREIHASDEAWEYQRVPNVPGGGERLVLVDVSNLTR